MAVKRVPDGFRRLFGRPRDLEAWSVGINQLGHSAHWLKISSSGTYISCVSPRRPVAPTPARRCWTQSAELERAGFRVAPALALAETRCWGLPADSYFVTASVTGAIPAGRFWRERAGGLEIAERRRLLGALARELRRFHEAGFYSRDANADNFLLRAEAGRAPEVFFLDLENVHHVGRVSRRRRFKNLVQMHGPVRGEVRRLDRLRFVREYAGRPLSDLRDWLRELTNVEARKQAEYRARRSAG